MEVLTYLNQYKINYPNEIEKIDNFVDFIRTDEKCYLRENLDRHITASCLLFNTAKDSILLTHHKKLNSWLPLGGHADGEPDPLIVAIKEAQEEAGIDEIKVLNSVPIDIDIHHIPQYQNTPPHLHYDLVFLLQSQNDNFLISEESLDLRWVKLDEITNLNPEERVARVMHKISILL